MLEEHGGPGAATARFVALFPLPNQKTAVPLRSANIKWFNSSSARSPTRQPVKRNKLKMADERVSCRSSTSRSSFRTWARSRPFGANCLPFEFLHRLGRVGWDQPLLGQPAEELPQGDETAIDRRHGLALLPTQVITEVGDVPGRDSLDRRTSPGWPS